jgi:hypothetical protein
MKRVAFKRTHWLILLLLSLLAVSIGIAGLVVGW